MGFNYKDKSLIATSSPVLLHEIRLITPEDCPLLQDLSVEYSKINIKSNTKERAACTLTASILMQKRVYFAVTRRGLQSLISRDPNLGEHNHTFDNNAWASLLAAFYNQFEIMELIHQGNTQNASAFRLKNLEIAEYLIDQGIDPAAQKVETLAFCMKKYKNKGK